VVKIITKILANRLAPHMNSLLSHAQNAFIKKRCIHDNFIYAQRVIQLLHRKKREALFIKLDISNVFDSIGWSFMLDVLEALGFSIKWRDWIAALLGTTTSKVLINGEPTLGIRHARGLRQGDPLSPLLFILAIDPLQRIIKAAAKREILKPVLPKAANLRCSLYVDDAAIFAYPKNTELDNLLRILNFFGECSGAKNQHIEDGIFFNKNGQHNSFSVATKFPGQDLQLPREIPRTSSTCSEAAQGGGKTPDRQNKGETTRLERQVLVHGRERDPSKNCAFSSADLPYDCSQEQKWLIRKIV
jgi:hypothetical protein